MYKKTLCLTPECSSLWALRPGLGFLYDSIIMDRKDYEDLISEQDYGTYNYLVAKNVERFRMEGMLQIRDFSTILKAEKRKALHEAASQYVESLNEKEQIKLTVRSHEDYRDYLKACILFYAHDEEQFKNRSQRLSNIMRRLQSLNEKPEMNGELVETLKRIAAKSLAGANIISQFDGAHLFDTSEYRPFITGMSIDELLYHDETETKAIDILAAVILNKNMPDITVYDDFTMTEFLKTRDDIKVLHSILNEIVAQYQELIKADPTLAKEALQNRFNDAIRKLDQYLIPIRKRTIIIWKLTEILGTIKLPIITPLLEPLREKNIQQYKAKQLQKLKAEDALMANMIFVFDEVQHGNNPLGLQIKKAWAAPKDSQAKIWGQQEVGLPWYEKE